METNKRNKLFSRLYCAAICFLLLSVIPGVRMSGCNSIAIILLSAVWLAEGNFSNKFRRLRNAPFVIITSVFYMLYVISIFVSANKRQAIHTAQNLLPLFILPVIFFSGNIRKKEVILFLYKAFIYGTALYMGTATIIALIQFSVAHDSSVLFYHQLVTPLKSTAIYAEMNCMVALVLILHMPASVRWKACMFFVFSIWIVMLASRMAIFIYLVITVINLLTRLPKISRTISLVAIALLIICLALTRNPIRKRFADFQHFHISYLTQPGFNAGIYFDGLSLRLVYWRYSLEILREKKAFIFGAGTGDARDLLDDKIRAYHMNTGNGTPGDDGYLKYSFHDLYLECLVSFGITGLCVLLIYYGYIGYCGIKHNIPALRDIFILLAISSLSDVIVVDAQCGLSLVLIAVYLLLQYDEMIRTDDIFKKVITRNNSYFDKCL